MVIKFSLKNIAVRLAVLAITLAALAFLVKAAATDLAAGLLSFEKMELNSIQVSQAVDFVPNSARLLAKLSSAEFNEKENFAAAEQHAQKAILLSPNNYKYRLLLAAIQDARGNQEGAEQTLKDALTVAPNYSEVHWRLANLLMREGKLEESIEQFKIVAQINPKLMPAALDLVWAVSGEDIKAATRLVPDDTESKLKFAKFLANRSRITEAADIFKQIEPSLAINSPDTSEVFGILMQKGFPKIVNDLWNKISSGKDETAGSTRIWNGDFETVPTQGQPTIFDWKISRSEYARISIAGNVGHSGKHSLQIEFTGRDTTRLDNEIVHLVILRPGSKNQLEYFVKTDNFSSPEIGPQIIISDSSNNQIAASESIANGTNDWKKVSVNFTAPSKGNNDAAITYIAVKRKPKYSFDEPTRGRIWLDDFSISEIK